MPLKQRHQKILFTIFIAALLVLLNINCFFINDLYSDYDLPDKDLGNEATWAVQYTEEALTSTAEVKRRWLTQTVAADFQSQTQTAAVFDQPPVITKIWVPNVVPANGSTTQGLIYFEDPDGDVDHVNYEVISAISFKSGTKLAPTLNYGTVNKGTYIINIHCELEQDVVMRATLVDKRKNTSNSVTFAFSCKNQG